MTKARLFGKTGSRARVSAESFRDDPMFPAVERAVAAILADGKVVAPVDVIVRIAWLSAADLKG
jgi:hypothetical protein